jgi:hypothetical protein
MKILAAFLTAAFLILSGCASMDRDTPSSFEPYSDSSGAMFFRFRADTASIAYPEGSDEAEAIRMEWLEGYLRSNNLCGQGYEILDRKPEKSSAIAGPAQSIYYVGKCIELQCW